MKDLLLIAPFVSAAAIAGAEKSVILPQQNAPMKIINYEAVYQEELRGIYVSHPDQIMHSVRCKNTSGKEIVAYQIGLAAFDAVDGFMEKFNGWAINSVGVDAEVEGGGRRGPTPRLPFRVSARGWPTSAPSGLLTAPSGGLTSPECWRKCRSLRRA